MRMRRVVVTVRRFVFVSMVMVMMAMILTSAVMTCGVHLVTDDRGLRAFVHSEPGGRDSCPEHARRADVHLRNRKAAQRVFQPIERQAGVQKRAEDHVARDAGEAIEVEDARHWRLSTADS